MNRVRNRRELLLAIKQSQLEPDTKQLAEDIVRKLMMGSTRRAQIEQWHKLLRLLLK